MYKIQTLNKISQTGLGVLGHGYSISDDEVSPDAVILRSFSMHETEPPESLLAVARAGAGVNNIPIQKCSDRGICVFNTPGANANAVKELVIAGLLLASRGIWQGINWARGLKGQADVPKLVEKGKGSFGGGEISGKTLGVVGVGGAIGVLVANACAALGMKVIGYDPFISDKAKRELSPEVRLCGLDETLAGADYITLHVPFNNHTKSMINHETIGKCRPGARLLNFARGELVDDGAIKAALADGKLAVYVTDFPNEALLYADNIITVPHLGASTEEAEENCAVMAASQLKDFLETGNVTNSVNFPAFYSGEAGGRLCVSYKNQDGLPEKICAAISAELNDFAFHNQVRDDVGYAVAIGKADCASGLTAMLREISGVTKVRYIKDVSHGGC